MALSIKNERTETLARQLAEATGESLTEAIQHSLEERLANINQQQRRTANFPAIMEILRRIDALPTIDSRSPDEILSYDENGLPS